MVVSASTQNNLMLWKDKALGKKKIYQFDSTCQTWFTYRKIAELRIPAKLVLLCLENCKNEEDYERSDCTFLTCFELLLYSPLRCPLCSILYWFLFFCLCLCDLQYLSFILHMILQNSLKGNRPWHEDTLDIWCWLPLPWRMDGEQVVCLIWTFSFSFHSFRVV